MEQQLEDLIRVALKHKATDVHFHIKDKEILMQLRKDGVLVKCDDFVCSLRLFRYLQYRSNLELSMMSAPQTGGFEMWIDDRRISLRFALIQSFQRISGVLRILNAENELTLESLYHLPEHFKMMKKALNRENGLILISGPTGSGKTTTLYTCLKSVSYRSIYTIEDPIEIYDEHFVQLQVNEALNMSYEQSIRQLMRHDPDIIMIGEIRDAAAAKGAVQSALSGHLVAATIHASSCVMAIERMKELGISEMLLKDVLCLVCSQRLLTTIHHNKVCASEMMNHQDLSYYFIHHCAPEGFHDLKENVRLLERKRLVSTFETEDLFN